MASRAPLLLLLFLALSAQALAVGFSNLPTQREYLFEPGLSLDIPLTVVGGDYIKVDVASSTPFNPELQEKPDNEGILKYVTLEDPAPLTGPRGVVVHIALPEDLPPNTYFVEVFATNTPPNPNGGTISAVATTKIRFTIRVLSPEKRIEILRLAAPPIAEGSAANVSLTVISRTKQDISAVWADITLKQGDEVLASGRTETKALPSAEQTDLSLTLGTEQLAGGEYNVTAVVHYDGDERPSNIEILKIGTLHVQVPSSTKEFMFNTTNRYTFTVANQWNRDLRDVYGVVVIGEQTKKTASQNVPSFGSTEYEIYFDRTEELLPGPTPVTITVGYEDYNAITKKYVEKEETFNLSVTVVLPPEPPKEGISMYWYLGGAALVLLIVLLVFLIMRNRRDTP